MKQRLVLTISGMIVAEKVFHPEEGRWAAIDLSPGSFNPLPVHVRVESYPDDATKDMMGRPL